MESIAALGLFIFLIAVYFAPAMIAGHRQHRNAGPICIVNLFFGWTLVGWVLTLAWAFSDQGKGVTHG